MKPSFLTLLLLPALLGPSGCGTAQRGDFTKTETASAAFSSNDPQRLAEQMVDELLAAPVMANLAPEGTRPLLFIDRVKNKTTEHFDTSSITDTIAGRLLKSGRFRFVERSKAEVVAGEFESQTDSSISDEARAMKVGRQLGAQFMLSGKISPLLKAAGSTGYLKLTMQLTNLETGLVEFRSEKEISRTLNKNHSGS